MSDVDNGAGDVTSLHDPHSRSSTPGKTSQLIYLFSQIYEVLLSGFVATSTPVRGARKRGRPRGSVGTSTRRPRARGSVRKAIHAAEAAAAQVGLSKGYAAYGYSLQGSYMLYSISSIYRIRPCDCSMFKNIVFVSGGDTPSPTLPSRGLPLLRGRGRPRRSGLSRRGARGRATSFT